MQHERRNYYEKLSEADKIRYVDKLQKCDNIDPYTLSEKDFYTDRHYFPEIELWDIANYLIYSMSPYTKKMFQAHKSMEAYRFFESGFVLNIGSIKYEDTAIVKGKVKHSQRMSEKPLEAWLLAKLSGEIICGHCTCPAGNSGTCSHVAALCFAVQNIRDAKETVSATDLLCKWNVPKFNDVSMSKAKNMKWTSASFEEPSTSSGITSSFRSYCDSLSKLSDELIQDFFNDLCYEGLDPAGRTMLYPDEIRRVTNIKDELFLANLYNESNSKKSLHELIELGKALLPEISEDDVKEITRLTLPRLKSKLCIALSRGRVTGSSFRDCCVTSVLNPSITTINRLMNPIRLFDNISTKKFHKKNKKKAISQFITEAKGNHENFQYEESGLIINPIYPYFTTSSDGIISCDCHGRGCIEVICLVLSENEELFDALTHKPHNVLKKVSDDFFLEKNHNLFYKMQMQIHLSNSVYGCFIIWTPTRNFVLQINADTEFWEKEKKRALDFHQQVVMPEILGKFFTRQKDYCRSQENDGETSEEYLDEFLQLVDLEIEPMD